MPHPSHPLHEIISDLLAANIPRGCILVKDPACRGDQWIPLFCSNKKSLPNGFCNVDLLILSNERIRVIVEIEEAKVTPTQIAGKFLTSALSSYFIHNRHGGVAIPKHDRLWFLQFVDTSRLPKGSSKPAQWRNIEAGIRSFLPLGGITEYNLFHVAEAEFRGQAEQQVVEIIRTAVEQPQPGRTSMAQLDRVRDAMRQQPFRPFTLRLVDRGSYVVKHPEFVALPPPPKKRDIVYYGEDGVHIIDLAMILELLLEEEPASTSPPGKGATGNGE
jgi:hypothetical protein